MALWGTKDAVYSDGTIAVSGLTVTGTGTTFNTSGLISEGDVIACGAGTTYGEAVIASVDSGTQLTLKANGADTTPVGTVVAGAAYAISQKPQSTLLDSNYSATEIFGVDTTEQGVANDASGDARKYAPPHAGWVGVSSYTDMHGNFRVKTETLVASSSISGDADDDTRFADS
tara:strand:+ start:82 stop:600 length:519 start_codon:yes stop_codon:yes gene_type:complete